MKVSLLFMSKCAVGFRLLLLAVEDPCPPIACLCAVEDDRDSLVSVGDLLPDGLGNELSPPR
jgi:hypothetical protein